MEAVSYFFFFCDGVVDILTGKRDSYVDVIEGRDRR